MLRCAAVTKYFRAGEVRTAALRDVTLEIAAGEYVAITGPSGGGKSTLLSVLGLVERCDAGEFWFDGENATHWSEAQLTARRRGRIGFVFQAFNLIDELTVRENVELSLEYAGVPAKRRRERAAATLDALGIAHRARHRPSELSGGQQQRVAIARALVHEPAVLLADEPTGNLDSEHGEEVMNLLDEAHARGTTIVMVTHSAVHAARASRIVHVRDGAVIDGAAAVADTP